MKLAREAWFWAALLTLISWACVQSGVWLGRALVAPGDGHPKTGEVQTDLFRFDSVYYLDIAENGYSYNGDPSSSPNLVFAPLFPMLTRALAAVTPLDPVTAGLLLNKVLLFLALAIWYAVLSAWLPAWRVRLTLLAMVTAAGSYAFHAFYSESTMFFALALCLWMQQRRRWLGLGAAAAALGASRLAALPLALIFAFLCLVAGWRASGPARLRVWCAAFLCVAGGAVHLAYLHWEFGGNPLVLLSTIQSVSWGRFHPETDWQQLLSGGYLLTYSAQALSRPTWLDIRTLNLFWMVAGLASVVYAARVWRTHALSYIFIPYALFIYATDSSSEFLISAHRFFAVCPTVFLMFGAPLAAAGGRLGPLTAGALIALMLAMNLAFGLLHAAAFNQGLWFWF